MGSSKEKYKCMFNQGFTLIELLVAVFIFTIVLSTVYGAFRTTFEVVGGSEKEIETLHQIAISLNRIRDDIGSIAAGGDVGVRGKKIMQEGKEGFFLSFAICEHIQSSREDQQRGWSRITYYTKADKKTGLLNLYRSDILLFSEDVMEENIDQIKDGFLILKDLNGSKVNFFDQEGTSFDEWKNVDENSQQSLFPWLISLQIEVASEEKKEKTGILYETAVAIQRSEPKI